MISRQEWEAKRAEINIRHAEEYQKSIEAGADEVSPLVVDAINSFDACVMLQDLTSSAPREFIVTELQKRFPEFRLELSPFRDRIYIK